MRLRTQTPHRLAPALLAAVFLGVSLSACSDSESAPARAGAKVETGGGGESGPGAGGATDVPGGAAGAVATTGGAPGAGGASGATGGAPGAGGATGLPGGFAGSSGSSGGIAGAAGATGVPGGSAGSAGATGGAAGAAGAAGDPTCGGSAGSGGSAVPAGYAGNAGSAGGPDAPDGTVDLAACTGVTATGFSVAKTSSCYEASPICGVSSCLSIDDPTLRGRLSYHSNSASLGVLAVFSFDDAGSLSPSCSAATSCCYELVGAPQKRKDCLAAVRHGVNETCDDLPTDCPSTQSGPPPRLECCYDVCAFRRWL